MCEGLQAPEEQLTASQRPLLVVLEEAEAVDTLTLQDLILVISEVSNTVKTLCLVVQLCQNGVLDQSFLNLQPCCCFVCK